MNKVQQELITDEQALTGATYHSGHSIPTYDDGFGPLWISRCSLGINGIVRAQSWEDAYGICEDEFFPEADETIKELVKEYGFKRDHVKVIHPATKRPDGTFALDCTIERDVTPDDYGLTGGALLEGQFVRWETRETPDVDAWTENEIFQENFGFRPNGPRVGDVQNHGIYSKDLNGDYLDPLTAKLVEELGITLQIEGDVTE